MKVQTILWKLILLLGLSAAPAVAERCCCTAPEGCSGQPHTYCVDCGSACTCTMTCYGPEFNCGASYDCNCLPTMATRVSGTYEGASVSSVVAGLVAGKPVDVSLLGDGNVPVTLSFKGRSLEWVLSELERQTGVSLLVREMPRGSGLGTACGSG